MVMNEMDAFPFAHDAAAMGIRATHQSDCDA
jgi:hypothetical protein